MKYLIILTILVIGIQCKSKVLRGNSGSLQSHKSDSFAISIPLGKKIAIKIKQLRLKPRGLVTVRNQQTGERIMFKMKRSTLYKINGTEKTVVRFPVSIELDATKIRVWVKNAKRFLAQYEAFVDDESNCRKDELSGDVTVLSCDSGDVNPVAESCDVSVPCPQNFVQDRISMTCHQGLWYGKPECLPINDIISSRCQIDRESAAVDSSCPYPTEELARYLVFHNPQFQTLQSDRAPAQTVDCRATCRHTANGAWLIDCGSPANYRVYVRCYVCRVYDGCKRHSVIFA